MDKFTIRPILWAYQKNAAEIYPIKIAVTVKRKVTYVLTGHRVHVKQWDEDANKVINHENAALINVAIRRKMADIERDLISRNLEGAPITKKAIKGQIENDKRFAKFAREVRADEKEIARITNYAGEGLMLSDINVTFLRKYEQHERARGMANNTVNTTFKYLRRIINQAAAEKLIAENPFDSFDIPKYRQSERIYLTSDELKRIMDATGEMDRSLYITTYYFLLGAYSGLRHSDWVRFNYKTMVEGNFLKLRPRKTRDTSGRWVVLPIGKTLNKILNVVKDLPPPVSNQKCNVMMKAIGSIAKIKKPLTTHVARHSFGYLCASNKIPKSVAAELMGVHTSTVEVYYHLSGQNIIDQAAVLKRI